MKKYVWVICVIALFALPAGVSASMCENRVLADYRSLASNINTHYTYYTESYLSLDGKPLERPTFDVTLSNIPEGTYVIDTSTGLRYNIRQFTGDLELTITGYEPNQIIRYQIIADIPGCYGQQLHVITVKLEAYNENSTDPVCKGAEEFSLCSTWGPTSANYDEFVAKVKAYKTKKEAKLAESKFPPRKDTLWDTILKFVGSYYVYLVGSVIVVIILIAIVKKLSVRKNQFDFKV